MHHRPLSLLWQLELPDMPASYILGTMHIQDQRAFSHLDTFYRLIDSCTAFASEFNLDEQEGMPQANQLKLPPLRRLHHFYRPKKYEKLRRIIRKSFGIDIHHFGALPPIIITQFITQAVLRADMQHTLDEELFKYAKRTDKQMLGLETMESQIQLLKSIPLKQQIQSLNAIGKNVSTFRKNLLQMTRTYQSGDLRKIHQASKKGARGMRQVMLYDRNHAMARALAAIARQQPVFAAVGAGHLAGQKGMLRLLKKDGFSVKEIILDH
jgi:uncharacterized protein YbaP (TraB family)